MPSSTPARKMALRTVGKRAGTMSRSGVSQSDSQRLPILGMSSRMSLAPAWARCPDAVAPDAHGLAGVTQDRFDDRDAGLRAVARRDGDRDVVDALPALRQTIEHGVRNGRRRTRAGDGDNAGGLGVGVELGEASDELARVGEVDVVQPAAIAARASDGSAS